MKSIRDRDKKIIWDAYKALGRIIGLLLVCLYCFGCASTSGKSCDRSCEINLLRERVEEAKVVRDKYKELLRKASTVKEANKAEYELSRAQYNYERAREQYNKKIEEIAEEKKFKKDPITIYGPIGIAIHLTEWIIEKLYILYP